MAIFFNFLDIFGGMEMVFEILCGQGCHTIVHFPIESDKQIRHIYVKNWHNQPVRQDMLVLSYNFSCMDNP